MLAIPSACNYLSEHVLPRMKKAFPRMEPVLDEATVYDLYSFLQKGKARVAVTAFSDREAEKLIAPYSGLGFHSEALMEDEYRVFLSTRHPLAQKDVLTLEDCSTLTLATYSNQVLGRRDEIFLKNVFNVLGVERYSYVNSRETILQLIAQNKAAGCFLEKMSAYSWYIVNGLIRSLPVQGIRLMPSRHYLVTLDEGALTDAERQAAAFIREHYCD